MLLRVEQIFPFGTNDGTARYKECGPKKEDILLNCQTGASRRKDKPSPVSVNFDYEKHAWYAPSCIPV